MRYSIKPKNRIYVKWCGFLFFAKNIGKNMGNKYSKKLLDSVKIFKTDAIETASKRAIKKTVEATGDLIGNKITEKITSASKDLHSKTDENEIEIPKERYISPERQKKYLRLA